MGQEFNGRGGTARGRMDTLSPRGEFFEQTKEGKRLKRMGASTDFSYLREGQFRLDPSIRALQEEGLGISRDAFSKFTNRSDALRSRYEGNRGALIEARTRPVTEMVNRQLQGLGRRGLTGSSFYSQTANRGATALGDARSEAEFETLQAISGIDKSQIAAAFQLASQMGDVGKARLHQELAGLGLGQQQIEMFLRSYEASQQRVLERRKAIAGTITNVIGGVTGGGGGGGAPTEDSGLGN